MKRVSFLVLGVMLVLAGPLVAQAAWEFKMSGTYTWKYTFINQLGETGFFGRFDQDARPAGVANAHSLNAWVGSEANDITVSGSDGAWNTMYMDTDMEIRINNVIRVRGRYHIGQWWTGAGTVPATGILDSTAGPYLVKSENINYLYPGVQRSFSPGYWNLLWLTADLPWGIVAVGKRPSTWGCGLAWNGDDNRSSESLALVAAYGPFRIGIGFYPSRGGFEGYYNEYYDKTGGRAFDVTFPNVTYRNGPLDMGIIFNIGPNRHRGPERTLGTAATKINAETRDRSDWYLGAYLKYFNGRFFFNTELDTYYRIDRLRDRNGFPNGAVSRYIEHYRYMFEWGTVMGPSKVALLYSWSSGNDRRNGYRDNISQGGFADPFSDGVAAAGIFPRWQPQSLSNTGLYRPYSYLMVYSYGLGAFINADTGEGYVEDAQCFALRYDHAVASNLNVYFSAFKAKRVGNGYGWGFLVPSTAAVAAWPADTSGLVQQQYKGTFVAGTPTVGAQPPNIPDDDLGYEFDAGFDWKLLEGLTLRATFAWWQAGNWFKYACVDRLNPGWAAPARATNWGINPDRSIDPIFGVEIKLQGEF